MKKLKSLTTLVISGGACLAAAQYSSPELIMVADQGDGTSVHPSRVERYDPYTGDYLGSFGTGYLTDATAVTVIGQDAYVADTVEGSNNVLYSRIEKFNFSTGAFDGTIFNSQPDRITGLATYGGNILAVDSGNFTSGTGGVYTLSPTGTLLGVVGAPFGTNDLHVSVQGSTAWVSSNGNYGYLTGYALNANGTLGASNSVAGQFFGVCAGTGNFQNYVYDTEQDASGNGMVFEKRLSNGVVVDSYDAGNLYPGNYPVALAMGHNGALYGMNDATSGGTTIIWRYDGNELGPGPLGAFNISANTYNPTDMAVYAAPEPASMAALGFGMLGLLRRRRQARSTSRG